jgi:hypothetical protein
MHPGFSMCCCKCCWVDQNVDKVSVSFWLQAGDVSTLMKEVPEGGSSREFYQKVTEKAAI